MVYTGINFAKHSFYAKVSILYDILHQNLFQFQFDFCFLCFFGLNAIAPIVVDEFYQGCVYMFVSLGGNQIPFELVKFSSLDL